MSSVAFFYQLIALTKFPSKHSSEVAVSFLNVYTAAERVKGASLLSLAETIIQIESWKTYYLDSGTKLRVCTQVEMDRNRDRDRVLGRGLATKLEQSVPGDVNTPASIIPSQIYRFTVAYYLTADAKLAKLKQTIVLGNTARDPTRFFK